jgi:hypothetical protein
LAGRRGWFNLVGLVFLLASVNVGLYAVFRDLFLGQVVGHDVARWTPAGEGSAGWWRQVICVAIVCAAQVYLNTVMRQ